MGASVLTKVYRGRPSASHYFVGVQGDYFFYLDPHQTRPMLPYFKEPKEYTEEMVMSCHTKRLRRIHVDQMDPSMLLAFLVRDEVEWQSLRDEMGSVQGKPVLHISDKEPIFCEEAGGEVRLTTGERPEAIKEVETLDDDLDEEGELINLPMPSL